jgi:hypothetical protein
MTGDAAIGRRSYYFEMCAIAIKPTVAGASATACALLHHRSNPRTVRFAPFPFIISIWFQFVGLLYRLSFGPHLLEPKLRAGEITRQVIGSGMAESGREAEGAAGWEGSRQVEVEDGC